MTAEQLSAVRDVLAYVLALDDEVTESDEHPPVFPNPAAYHAWVAAIARPLYHELFGSAPDGASGKGE